MKHICTVYLLIYSFYANASFINQYSDWKRLSYAHKEGYVMGVFDGLSAANASFGVDAVAEAIGFHKCAARLRLSSIMLIEIIEEGYKKDLKLWSSPPDFILHNELMPACRSDINVERKSFNLKPYTPN